MSLNIFEIVMLFQLINERIWIGFKPSFIFCSVSCKWCQSPHRMNKYEQWKKTKQQWRIHFLWFFFEFFFLSDMKCEQQWWIYLNTWSLLSLWFDLNQRRFNHLLLKLFRLIWRPELVLELNDRVRERGADRCTNRVKKELNDSTCLSPKFVAIAYIIMIIGLVKSVFFISCLICSASKVLVWLQLWEKITSQSSIASSLVSGV